MVQLESDLKKCNSEADPALQIAQGPDYDFDFGADQNLTWQNKDARLGVFSTSRGCVSLGTRPSRVTRQFV
jgi:hypothetical protein